MSCEICGRWRCTRSFHSSEEIEQFDSVSDGVKDRCREIIKSAVYSVDGSYSETDGVYLIDLEDALKAIDNVDL